MRNAIRSSLEKAFSNRLQKYIVLLAKKNLEKNFSEKNEESRRFEAPEQNIIWKRTIQGARNGQSSTSQGALALQGTGL
ncbi:MAG: hypothetical protein IPL65_21670 [Lewinellaceae bacterium]|nr:hypothetical protein [Lewinellaceae bacterium]